MLFLKIINNLINKNNVFLNKDSKLTGRVIPKGVTKRKVIGWRIINLRMMKM